MRTEIYIDSGDEDENKKYFDQLYNQRESIEDEFGQSLEWERLDAKRASRVAIYREGSIDDSTDELQDIHAWGIKNLLQFKKVFGSKA